jgi:hypothetical protein
LKNKLKYTYLQKLIQFAWNSIEVIFDKPLLLDPVCSTSQNTDPIACGPLRDPLFHLNSTIPSAGRLNILPLCSITLRLHIHEDFSKIESFIGELSEKAELDVP